MSQKTSQLSFRQSPLLSSRHGLNNWKIRNTHLASKRWGTSWWEAVSLFRTEIDSDSLSTVQLTFLHNHKKTPCPWFDDDNFPDVGMKRSTAINLCLSFSPIDMEIYSNLCRAMVSTCTHSKREKGNHRSPPSSLSSSAVTWTVWPALLCVVICPIWWVLATFLFFSSPEQFLFSSLWMNYLFSLLSCCSFSLVMITWWGLHHRHPFFSSFLLFYLQVGERKLVIVSIMFSHCFLMVHYMKIHRVIVQDFNSSLIM